MVQIFLGKISIGVPIVLAPMAGPVGPDLAAAISNAGGLGMLPIWEKVPAAALADIKAIKALSPKKS